MGSSRNFLANVKPENGKHLSTSCGYRGNLATQAVDEIQKVPQRMSDDFVALIPNNIKSSIITIPPEDTPLSGTFVANNTALKFAKLYKRKE